MRFVAGLALAGVLLAAGAAAAQEPDAGTPKVEDQYSDAYDLCLNTPEGMTTAGAISCTADELKIQDKVLNETYRKAMSKLNTRQQAKLRTAQRAWIAFRDAHCNFLYDEDWGSMSTVEANVCVLTMTIERELQLRGYAEG